MRCVHTVVLARDKKKDRIRETLMRCIYTMKTNTQVNKKVKQQQENNTMDVLYVYYSGQEGQ